MELKSKLETLEGKARKVGLSVQAGDVVMQYRFYIAATDCTVATLSGLATARLWLLAYTQGYETADCELPCFDCEKGRIDFRVCSHCGSDRPNYSNPN